jgi:hypothetical protein
MLDGSDTLSSQTIYFHNMRNITMNESNGSTPQEQEQILPVDNATVPYWRTELHALDEYRTTEELPTECDVAIISKLAGDNKSSVVVLEARQLCSGATGRNGVGKFDPQTQNVCLLTGWAGS